MFTKMISLFVLKFGFHFYDILKNLYRLQRQNSKDFVSEISVSHIGAEDSPLNISGSLNCFFRTCLNIGRLAGSV